MLQPRISFRKGRQYDAWVANRPERNCRNYKLYCLNGLLLINFNDVLWDAHLRRQELALVGSRSSRPRGAAFILELPRPGCRCFALGMPAPETSRPLRPSRLSARTALVGTTRPAGSQSLRGNR